MIIKNIQERNRRLIYYYSFFISLLFAVFITNIQGKQSLYIFLLVLIILLNLTLYRTRLVRLSLLIIAWFVFWFFISQNNTNIIAQWFKQLAIQTNNYNKKVDIDWQIIDEYRQWDVSNTYIIKLNKIDTKDINEDITILWTINNKIRIENWDLIEFSSKLYEINNFNEFEYDKFLIMKGIYAQASIYQIVKKWNVESGYSKKIRLFRNNIMTTINNIYPWDTAKLLNWILLGQKWDYDKELKTNFNNSWLSHIITVSWYNITIIIIFLNIFLKFLPKKLKIIIITLSIIFFIALIWDNLPAVRAWIMWIMCYIAMLYWRKINIYSLLVFIITILIIINPLIINYDIGFQLCFMALLGLITINNWLNSCLSFVPNKLQIRESISSTLSVTIFTLPIVLINFGKISIISVITNLLVLPTIPISMLLGSISVLAYYINSSFWVLIWYSTYLFLKYVLILVWYFWKLSIATVGLELWDYNYLFFILYYFLLLYLILILRPRNIQELREKN